jgi:hypothetical protein
MSEPTPSREGPQFYMNVPEKLDDPFPDLHYFLEKRPVFYYPPLHQWFVGAEVLAEAIDLALLRWHPRPRTIMVAKRSESTPNPRKLHDPYLP